MYNDAGNDLVAQAYTPIILSSVTRARAVKLDAEEDYKIVIELRADVADSGTVGQSKANMDSIEVNNIVVQLAGGGCPFIQVWDGAYYVEDNNILGNCEENNFQYDVEDFYLLQETPIGTNNKYNFYIDEYENDHGYLDNVKLLMVEHEPDVSIAVTQSGKIVTYNEPAPPISCITDEGSDELDFVSSFDFTSTQINPGTSLYIDFGLVEINNDAKILLQMGCPKSPLYAFTLDENHDWQHQETVWIRRYWSLYVVTIADWQPAEDGHYMLRLDFTETSDVDFIDVDISPNVAVEVREAKLTMAEHSADGNVKNRLKWADGQYVELLPGERLQLEFTGMGPPSQERDYIFYSYGRYTPIE